MSYDGFIANIHEVLNSPPKRFKKKISKGSHPNPTFSTALETSLARKYIYTGFILGSFLGSIPYEWNRKHHSFSCTQSVVRKRLWYFNIFVLIMGEAFILGRLLEFSKREDEHSINLIPYLGLTATVILLALCFHTNLLRSNENLILAIQKSNVFFNSFKESVAWESASSPKLFSAFDDPIGAFFLVAYYSGINAVAILVSLSFLQPGWPIFFSSVSDDPKKFHFCIYVLQACYIIYTSCSVLAVFMMFFFPLVYILFCGLKTLDSIRNYKASPWGWNMYRAHQAIDDYQKLATLHKHTLPSFTSFIIPSTQLLLMMCAIFSIYGATTMSGIPCWMLFFIATGVSVTLAIMFSMLGSFHGASSKLLQTWKDQRGSPLIRKRLKSLAPLRIAVGKMYYGDEGLVLTIFSIIFESTANLLVLY